MSNDDNIRPRYANFLDKLYVALGVALVVILLLAVAGFRIVREWWIWTR